MYVSQQLPVSQDIKDVSKRIQMEVFEKIGVPPVILHFERSDFPLTLTIQLLLGYGKPIPDPCTAAALGSKRGPPDRLPGMEGSLPSEFQGCDTRHKLPKHHGGSRTRQHRAQACCTWGCTDRTCRHTCDTPVLSKIGGMNRPPNHG